MKLFFLCFTFYLTFTGAEYTGKVVRVVDGDTIVMLHNSNNIKIRLAEIDAPEKGQDFGEQSRLYLASLIAGKDVKVVSTGKDRYKRILGVVYTADGKNINEEMVRAGYAWHFKKYSKSEPLRKLEEMARRSKAGLWSNAKPVAPWDFRTGQNKKLRIAE